MDFVEFEYEVNCSLFYSLFKTSPLIVFGPIPSVHVCVRARACVCVRAHACVRACVRECVP